MPKYIGYNFTGTANTSVTKTLPNPNFVDSNFENTVLLLHGDGTNTGQNNTFLDSSSNAFTITRNGNATQGTFSPFSKADGRWGSYFDGTGDYLQVNDTSSINFSTNDFTIEGWFFRNPGVTTYQQLIDYRPTSTQGLYPNIYLDNSSGTNTGVAYSLAVYVNSSNIITSGTEFTSGVWHHVALSRVSGTTKLFVDGTQVGSSYSDSNSYLSPANRPMIACSGYTIGDIPFLGYMSNIRVLKGTGLYTGTFIPPTAPLTNITNTSLLTCQSNRFKDNSSNDFTITSNGNVTINPFSPFADTTDYSAATKGGSGYFDGTGDYLEGTNTATLNFGSGDWTVEAWVYLFTTASFNNIVHQATDTVDGWLVDINTSGNARIVSDAGGTWGVDVTGSTALSTHTWYHLAFVRYGSDWRIYVNGVSDGSATISDSIPDSSANFQIGSLSSLSRYFSGYISNLRVVKGTAVYTGAFTPPTAPLTAITNTSLLLNFTNGQIIDSTGMNDLETVGNVQISTAQYKYGTASILFDGTGDYLYFADQRLCNFYTGDFTIEMWLRTDAIPGPGTSGLQIPISGYNYNAAGTWRMYLWSNGTLRWYGPDNTQAVGARITGTTGLSVNTWYHVAVCRSGSNIRLFINGTQDGSTSTNNGNYNSCTAMTIGDGTGTYPNYGFDGYIDDVRITKGIARYTGTFTPPTRTLDEVEPALETTVDKKYNSGIWSISDSSGEEYSLFTRTKQGNWLTSSRGDPIPPVTSIEYIVVAGGGGGGGGAGNGGTGGGGAGGFRTATGFNVSPGSSYPVTVGGGGAAGSNSYGAKGSDSVFSTTTSTGGGGGRKGSNSSTINGGSGGGGSENYAGGISSPATSPAQGNNGGSSVGQSGGSGGGGAGASGGNASNGVDGGDGGAGNGAYSTWATATSTGDSGYYAGGGGGGAQDLTLNYGDGGIGGGGRGGRQNNSVAALAGTVNTGGGGGGSRGTAAAGGSGIVIIRYLGSNVLGSGGTVTSSGGYTYHTFTSSGTFTWT